MERDLQRGRYQGTHIHRPIKRFPKYSTPISSPPVSVPRGATVERLHEKKTEPIDDANSETVPLRAQLEQAERLANEYKAQLHTQTLKTSANNSRNHLSEIELEKVRARLQKRIEELEPLPELLKEVELKNEKLQKQNNDLQKRLAEQSTFFTQSPTQDPPKENHHHSSDEDHRTLQRYSIERRID